MVECIGACMLCIQMPSAHADIKIFTHLEDDFVFASMHTFLFKYCNWNKILKMNNGHTIGGENGKNVRYQVRMDDRYTSTRYQVPGTSTTCTSYSHGRYRYTGALARLRVPTHRTRRESTR